MSDAQTINSPGEKIGYANRNAPEELRELLPGGL